MKTFNKLGVLFLLGLMFGTVLSGNLLRRNLGESSYLKTVLQAEEQVIEKSGNYYTYKVYSDNEKVIIQILDKDLYQTDFTFKAKKPSNKIQFRVAYNKYVIVQEKTSSGKSVTYWVLTITKFCKFYSLQSFAVSSTVDNQGYQFQNHFLLTSVVEYNEIDQMLYVSLDSPTQGYEAYDTYGIDLKNKGQKLLIVGWFAYNVTKKEKIVGGNSRVLVQATNDQFWFDTTNRRMPDEPTIYDKVKISSFTKLPIYPGGSYAYTYFQSYFQYVSLSSNKLKLTTFAYQGYKKTSTVYGQASLNSTSPIKIFSDEQTYFLAIGSNDIYVSTLEWNSKKQDYELWSDKLTNFISDKKERSKWLEVFNSAEYVFYYQRTFFILSQKYFYTYKIGKTYEKLLKCPLSQQSDWQKVMLTQMEAYLSSPACK